MQSGEDLKDSEVNMEAVDIPSSTSSALIAKIKADAEMLISEVIEEGSALYEQVKEIDKIKDDDPDAARLVKSHALGQKSKQLALLYRDVIFEVQKAELLHQEGSVSSDKLNLLIDQSEQTIQDATEAYKKGISTSGLSNWSPSLLVKQDHPWPIYKTQLSEIKDHLASLYENESKLSDLSEKVQLVRRMISETMEGITNRLEDLETQSQNILRSRDESDIDKAISLLTGTNESLDKYTTIAFAHAQIESAIRDTPVNLTAIVNINGGLLVEEELSPQYQIEQWYDIEILPLIEDAYQQLDTMTYNLRLSLINISNRLELLNNNSKAFQLEEHLQPLERFEESIPKFRSSIEGVVNEVSEKIKENLSLDPLLSADVPFLSLGFQSSINRFKKEQNLLIERIRYYWGALKGKYFSIKSTVQEESRLGDVEKVIRYIQGASTDRRNLHYNNFFNAKVTMVEAFWMGRELEQKRIAQVIKSWNDGFQGAILFHGDRYAGKSSLGDWVSQQYFRGKTYALKPNRAIIISKKKIDISDDLIKSIRSFVDRVQYAKPMIWIDDLELWFNDEHLSDEVATQLIDLINEYGKRVLFAVSMGSWMYRKLNRLMDFDHSFQSIIELSPFSKDVLKEAILLRHGASHKTLIGTDGQEVSNIEFDRYVNLIARQSNGNVGHALQLWVNSIEYKDDQHVQIREVVTYKFPDIVTSDNGIILATLLVYRKLAEEELKSLLGPSYEDRFRKEVSRLAGYGIIRRSYNGMLSVNDKVVPAVTSALRKNRFIE